MHQLSESARKGGRERLRGQIVGFHADEGPRATSAALAKYGFGEQSRAMAATADTAEDRALADQQRVWGTVYKILSTVTVAERQARDAGKDDAGVDMAMRNAWDTAVKGLANTWTGEGESPIAAFKFEDREDIMMKALALSKQQTPGRYIDLASGLRWDKEADTDELTGAQIANNAEILNARKEFVLWLQNPKNEMGRVRWSTLTEGSTIYTSSLVKAMNHLVGDDPGFEEFWDIITERTTLAGDPVPTKAEIDAEGGIIQYLAEKFARLGGGGGAAFDFDDPDASDAAKTAALKEMLEGNNQKDVERATDLIVEGIWLDDKKQGFVNIMEDLKRWGISIVEFIASMQRQGFDFKQEVAPITGAWPAAPAAEPVGPLTPEQRLKNFLQGLGGPAGGD
jgi:hypothetical protein